jgi:hypothetical protein
VQPKNKINSQHAYCILIKVKCSDSLTCGEAFRPLRLAYQPPASSTFISEQIIHQQLAINTFLSE